MFQYAIWTITIHCAHSDLISYAFKVLHNVEQLTTCHEDI